MMNAPNTYYLNTNCSGCPGGHSFYSVEHGHEHYPGCAEYEAAVARSATLRDRLEARRDAIVPDSPAFYYDKKTQTWWGKGEMLAWTIRCRSRMFVVSRDWIELGDPEGLCVTMRGALTLIGWDGVECYEHTSRYIWAREGRHFSFERLDDDTVGVN